MSSQSPLQELPQSLARSKYFKPLIARHGVPQWENRGSVFQSLVRSIVYQQVTGKAAASILNKFKSLYGTKFPTPKQVLETPVTTLRSAGLSSQKVSYILDLSTKMNDGTIKPRVFSKMTNEEIIEHLTAVKGIGVWTAQMFLMSTLHRENILPTLDLGIKKGFQIVYTLSALPTHDEMEHLSKKWRQHASLGSWYLWRAADEHKTVKKV